MEILFLGTAGAMPTVLRDNTALAVRIEGVILLIDTPGCIVQKMMKVGWNPVDIRYVIITHIHPDHAYGLPSLIHVLWMMGKKGGLDLFLPESFLVKMQSVIDAYGLHSLRDFSLKFSPVSLAGSTVIKGENFEVNTFPVRHSIPNVGVKVVWDDKKVVYTSDTELCESVVENARNADILIHESNESLYLTGGQRGHSTAKDAGRVAHWSGAKKLFLVHIGPALTDKVEDLIREAGEEFEGEIIVPNDLDVVVV